MDRSAPPSPEEPLHSPKPLNPDLLGRIVLARFLELPLAQFNRLVARTEAAPAFLSLSPWIKPTILTGARIHPTPSDPPILGKVHDRGTHLEILYHSRSFAREYHTDDAVLRRLKVQGALPAETVRILHRIHLINSRNHLTHAIVRALLTLQAPYLRSGDPKHLVPLSRMELARYLNVGRLTVAADPSRISRLIRGLTLQRPDGRIVPLTHLFPQPRQIHCHWIDELLKKEKRWLAEGILKKPWSDRELADLVERRTGFRLHRRTVTSIRHHLAIPNHRHRRQRTNYLAATEGFSPLVALTPHALRTLIPEQGGVYEIRAADLGLSDRGDLPAKVLYIGSTANLRKRLGDHLRGSSGNPLLHHHLSRGNARVRYRVLSHDWRSLERQLYQAFCDTFGEPPPCNRMKP